MKLLSDLRKLIWVLMHHPDYRQCYVKSPFLMKGHVDMWGEGIRWDLTLGLVIPSVYFPWNVSVDYLAAHRVESECLYDDIPF